MRDDGPSPFRHQGKTDDCPRRLGDPESEHKDHDDVLPRIAAREEPEPGRGDRTEQERNGKDDRLGVARFPRQQGRRGDEPDEGGHEERDELHDSRQDRREDVSLLARVFIRHVGDRERRGRMTKVVAEVVSVDEKWNHGRHDNGLCSRLMPKDIPSAVSPIRVTIIEIQQLTAKLVNRARDTSLLPFAIVKPLPRLDASLRSATRYPLVGVAPGPLEGCCERLGKAQNTKAPSRTANPATR